MNTSKHLRVGLLVVATLGGGLMAGLFAVHAHTVMPGLTETDGVTQVLVMNLGDATCVWLGIDLLHRQRPAWTHGHAPGTHSDGASWRPSLA